jgi:hypothetical protein
MDEQPKLRLEVALPPSPVSLSQPCPVTVRLVNEDTVPLMVNRRLAVGYRDHHARELFADLRQAATGQPASIRQVDYERQFSPPEDYGTLEPGESISQSFNLFDWYAPQKGGSYQLIVYYQADEPLAKPPPEVVPGIYASPAVDLQVTTNPQN